MRAPFHSSTRQISSHLFIIRPNPSVLEQPRPCGHRGNTVFAVRSPRFRVSGYCTKWRIQASMIARIHACQTSKLCQETQYLASILSNAFVKCICRNIRCALGKWSLHSWWNFFSTFTEFRVHGDERWPTEVTSNTYFRGVVRVSLVHC